jgi:hypothetical protein
MSKSGWTKAGLAVSAVQCAYAAEHRRGVHRVFNKPCLLCFLKWIAAQ